ncbi:Dual specificity protein phosphatase 1 [Gonapodya sp. JEL0774]|nr:Dual specificity protein phosphatase 1 [Gonapodya sp. JEL0774]
MNPNNFMDEAGTTGALLIDGADSVVGARDVWFVNPPRRSNNKGQHEFINASRKDVCEGDDEVEVDGNKAPDATGRDAGDPARTHRMSSSLQSTSDHENPSSHHLSEVLFSSPPSTPDPASAPNSPAIPIAAQSLLNLLNTSFLHTLIIDASSSAPNMDSDSAFPGARRLPLLSHIRNLLPSSSFGNVHGDPCIVNGDLVTVLTSDSSFPESELTGNHHSLDTLFDPRLKRVDSGWEPELQFPPSECENLSRSRTTARPTPRRPVSTTSLSLSSSSPTTTVPPSPSTSPTPSLSSSQSTLGTARPTHILLRPIPPAPFSPLLPIPSSWNPHGTDSSLRFEDDDSALSPTSPTRECVLSSLTLPPLLHLLHHPNSGLPACEDPHYLRIADPELRALVVVDEVGTWGGWAMRIAEVFADMAMSQATVDTEERASTNISTPLDMKDAQCDYATSRLVTPRPTYWLVGGMEALRVSQPNLFSPADPTQCIRDSREEELEIEACGDVRLQGEAHQDLGCGEDTTQCHVPTSCKLEPNPPHHPPTLRGRTVAEMSAALRRRQDRMVDAVWYTPPPTLLDPPVLILPQLYLGSLHSAHPILLERFGITTVVRLGRFDVAPPTTLRNGKRVRVLDWDVEDSPGEDMAGVVEEVARIVDEESGMSGRVLVHCHAGVSRSATCVLAYLISRRKMTLESAFRHVFDRRPIVRPNPGFSLLLRRLELLHHPSLKEPTVPRFWLSTSYLYTIEWAEWRWRAGIEMIDEKIVAPTPSIGQEQEKEAINKFRDMEGEKEIY